MLNDVARDSRNRTEFSSETSVRSSMNSRATCDRIYNTATCDHAESLIEPQPTHYTAVDNDMMILHECTLPGCNSTQRHGLSETLSCISGSAGKARISTAIVCVQTYRHDPLCKAPRVYATARNIVIQGIPSLHCVLDSMCDSMCESTCVELSRIMQRASEIKTARLLSCTIQVGRCLVGRGTQE